MVNKWLCKLASITLSLSLMSFSAIAEDEVNPVDPWEGFNRSVFTFNDTLDTYISRPVAVVYNKVMPQRLDDGVSNVFSNLADVVVIVNDLLQGKFKQGGQDLGRFLVNSTVGIAGLVDVGSRIGLDKNEEDFGQTLGYWGVDAGPYLMLPLYGPSTVRDAFGSVVNSQLDLVRYVDHVPTRNQLYGLRMIDKRDAYLELEDAIFGDKYTYLRDVYLQRRAFLVNDGEVEDPFGEDGEEIEYDFE